MINYQAMDWGVRGVWVWLGIMAASIVILIISAVRSRGRRK